MVVMNIQKHIAVWKVDSEADEQNKIFGDHDTEPAKLTMLLCLGRGGGYYLTLPKEGERDDATIGDDNINRVALFSKVFCCV